MSVRIFVVVLGGGDGVFGAGSWVIMWEACIGSIVEEEWDYLTKSTDVKKNVGLDINNR